MTIKYDKQKDDLYKYIHTKRQPGTVCLKRNFNFDFGGGGNYCIVIEATCLFCYGQVGQVWVDMCCTYIDNYLFVNV